MDSRRERVGTEGHAEGPPGVTRVYVVDADAENRRRAGTVIAREPRLRVVGGGDGAGATLDELVEAIPHVCLVGTHVADRKVPQFLRLVHEQLPATRCVRLPTIPTHTTGGRTSALRRFHDQVIQDFLAELVLVARRMSPDETSTPPSPSGGPDSGFWLTGREREILQRVRAGLSNPEIAGDLGLSEKTVRNTLMSTLAKLGTDRASEIRRGP